MDYMMLSILTKDKATVDVKGECTLKDYEDHIEVLSYSHGVSLPVQAGTSNTGRTTGHPNFGELSITKQLDSTTPALNYYCAQAKNLGTLKLKLVRQDSTNAAAGQVLYMTYALDKTLISSVSVGGSGVSGGNRDVQLQQNYLDIHSPEKGDCLRHPGEVLGSETNTGTA